VAGAEGKVEGEALFWLVGVASQELADAAQAVEDCVAVQVQARGRFGGTVAGRNVSIQRLEQVGPAVVVVVYQRP
jgi:hypothetical protein